MNHLSRDRRRRLAAGGFAICWLLVAMMTSTAAATDLSVDAAATRTSPTSVVAEDTDAPARTGETRETGLAASGRVPEAQPKAIRDWYALGGWVMHLLVLCSALVVGVVAERLWALRPAVTVPGRLERALLENAGSDPAACLELCGSRRSALARVSTAVIEGRAVGLDESRERLALAGSHEVRRLHGGLDLLAGLANIATMLGLLGTVLGMISAFGTIALVGTSDARVVAGGIFEALVTTAAGLVVGLTALACHTHLVRRAEAITTRIEAVAAALIDGANPLTDDTCETRETRAARLVTRVS